VVWRQAASILAEEGIDAALPEAAPALPGPDAAAFTGSEAAARADDEADGAGDYDQSDAAESGDEADPAGAAAEGAVRVREAGVVFLANPEKGQKTGGWRGGGGRGEGVWWVLFVAVGTASCCGAHAPRLCSAAVLRPAGNRPQCWSRCGMV
jgi:hypothetical protein